MGGGTEHRKKVNLMGLGTVDVAQKGKELSTRGISPKVDGARSNLRYSPLYPEVPARDVPSLFSKQHLQFDSQVAMSLS